MESEDEGGLEAMPQPLEPVGRRETVLYLPGSPELAALKEAVKARAKTGKP